MELFMPEAGLVFWMFVVFVVLLAILAKFAWPVVIKMIDERAALIDKGVEYAEAAKASLEDSENKARAIVAEAHRQQMEMLQEAAAMKTQIIEDAKKAAAEEAKKLDITGVADLVKRTAFKITRMGQLVGSEASRRLGVPFGIVDLSLAPTPAVGDSVAYILEEMGVETQLGKERLAVDYWLSYTGPSDLFKTAMNQANKDGKEMYAKIGVNTNLAIEKLKNINGFKTLILNKNTEKTNVVLGAECETLYGDGFITDILCGVKVKLSPLSFYQVNHDTAELLYNKAKEYAALTKEDDFLDLYCGTG